MPPQYVYTMVDLRKVVPPQREILKGIYLAFFPGAKIGVLGLNGAGKSSLLKIMAGLDKDFNGEAFPAEGTRVGFLAQDPWLDPAKTVLENVEAAVAPVKNLLARFDELSEKMGESLPDDEMDKVMAEYGKVQDAIEAAGGWDLDRTLETAMDALRCPPADADVTKISGGERRRVALCRVLLERPDLLLLDEPTNHLDAESVAWLEHHLAEYPGTVVAVTHDRYFLDNVAQWILELDRGAGIPWKGNYSSWLEQKKNRLAQEEKAESAKQKTLERELEWVRMAPRARHAKGKARLQAYEQLLADSGPEGRGETQEIYIPAGPRLGDVVVRAEGLRKAYGDKLLFDDLSFDLPKGGIVGVIGANGAGKTTLFKMIMGLETPDGGALTVGETVVPSYVDQNRDRPDPKKTVWEEVSGGDERILVGKREISSRAWCSMFNFKGADQQKRIGDLSGGEMNRLHLARTVKRGGNLLLLDEPTNDLDVDTLRALEEALLSFAGCAVVISHDRWFLDRVATHMLAFEGDSKTFWYEGNYQEYEADRHKRLGAAADMPHRIKYRKLTTG
ncbi:MAG: energy-dependent translational throttle protein EttA [Acidobacteria bacterium]|nr:MAG: energy-dependent translational throttle protein EttA [Acidobacteriota bacterium]MCE7957641.1 energy-dependent translational throttle protein EttA [Acidobacteria bacterium ACB2]